jgi:hypothetical protein
MDTSMADTPQLPDNTAITPTEVAPRKTGRPSKYNPEIAAEICSRLASSTLGIQAICQSEPRFPHFSVIYDWISRNARFAEIFARARQQQADLLAYEALRVAYTPEEGQRIERKRVGWTCSACARPAKWHSTGFEHMDGSALCDRARVDPVIEEKVILSDMIDHRRLKVGQLQWTAGRLNPRAWGDRQAIEQRLVDGDGKDRPLTLEDYRRMVEEAEKIGE